LCLITPKIYEKGEFGKQRNQVWSVLPLKEKKLEKENGTGKRQYYPPNLLNFQVLASSLIGRRKLPETEMWEFVGIASKSNKEMEDLYNSLGGMSTLRFFKFIF